MMKKDCFELIKTALYDAEVPVSEILSEEEIDELIEFCNREQELIALRADKARALREKKKAATPDPMIDTVYSVMTAEPQSLDELLVKILAKDKEATRNKIALKALELSKAGRVVRSTVKKDDGHERVMYCLA